MSSWRFRASDIETGAQIWDHCWEGGEGHACEGDWWGADEKCQLATTTKCW